MPYIVGEGSATNRATKEHKMDLQSTLTALRDNADALRWEAWQAEQRGDYAQAERLDQAVEKAEDSAAQVWIKICKEVGIKPNG